jgi:hypothetical protein
VTAVEVLTTIEARGAFVAIDGDDLLVRPKGILTPELRAAAVAVKPEILAEVRWRADVMRRQVPPAPHPILCLVARPGERPVPGTCQSCGGPLSGAEGFGRCSLCALAMWLACSHREAPVCA